MRTANREKPLQHQLCSFTSSLCTCPASSVQHVFCVLFQHLVWSNIRNSLDAEKAEKLIKKYTDFTELKKITSRIYSNCSNYSIFFKSFKFRCCSFCFIKINVQLTVYVHCLFYLSHSTFFKGKEVGFLVGFIVLFSSRLFKKTGVFCGWVQLHQP